MIVIGILSLASRFGAQKALLYAWPPAMLLLPVWMIMEVGSLTLDLRTVAEVTILVSFLLFPEEAPRLKVNFCDLAVLFLLGVQVVSQFHAGSIGPLTVPEIARKWLLPYLMGRLFFRSEKDLTTVLNMLCPMLVVLTALTVFECFVKINPINKALGMSFGLLEEGEGYRWGMKRAHVTFNHPIFFGMMLVLMLPWSLEAGRRAKTGEGPRWWRHMPKLLGLSLFCCVSRGPQLAGMFTAVAYFFFRTPKARIPMICSACALIFLLQANKDVIVELLGKAAGETQDEKKMIDIDGEEYEYSGTTHRMLLFKVYDKSIQAAGFFGFGTEMKGVVVDEELQQTFGSIDCHYLMFLLQHGWFGVGAFVILMLAVVIKLGRRALQIEKPGSALAAGLAGAMAGVAMLLVSVWFSVDFAGVWIFSAGLASGLQFPPSTGMKVVRSVITPRKKQTKIEAKPRRYLTPPRPIERDTHHA
jgi:hypothetical protein